MSVAVEVRNDGERMMARGGVRNHAARPECAVAVSRQERELGAAEKDHINLSVAIEVASAERPRRNAERLWRPERPVAVPERDEQIRRLSGRRRRGARDQVGAAIAVEVCGPRAEPEFRIGSQREVRSWRCGLRRKS
jgi:hypothetical protein